MPRPLSASDLLDLWERGVGRLPVEQALLLLRVAYPDMPAVDLPRLPVGQRDAALMRLREMTFGSPLNGLATCPACGEQVEIGFALEELFSGYAGYDDPPALPADTEPERVSAAGFDLAFRLPNSADLMNLPPDPRSARLALLRACLVEARREGQPVEAADLPDEAIQALVASMDQADPFANISLPLTCPACSNRWEVTFDIVAFFWGEINAWAQRLLREVHTLASAYGWREADILAMSAWRRQNYLELVGA